MVKFLRIFLILLFGIFNSCKDYESLMIPNTQNSELKNAEQIEINKKYLIDGVYDVVSGSQQLGNKVVIKSTEKSISVFTGKNLIYFVFESGNLDSNVILEGYWRAALETSIGPAKLKILSNEGALDILSGKETQNIIIRGDMSTDSKNPVPIELKLNRRFNKAVKSLYIIAHRGGGRNADQLPASENSLEIIRLAEGFGANGIEIDVRLTKDGIPILYHDENFNSRIINSDILLGPVSNFNYFQIKNYCTLKQGETIPTLEEALNTVIYETNLHIVWLDLKDIRVVDKIIPIQMDAIKKAKEIGRDLIILMGLPTTDILNKYQTIPEKSEIPAICEIGYDETIASNSLAWAPRWTMGIPQNEAVQLHNRNKMVITWTLDNVDFVQKYLKENVFDGFVTNYPSILAYEYYMQN
jgi:glycerophosphoryl diester phosphodiesterase